MYNLGGWQKAETSILPMQWIFQIRKYFDEFLKTGVGGSKVLW